MQITTKPQAKTIVSALRRELKAMSKSTDTLSHNDCLTVMAKALGFTSWNQWEASLEDAPTPAVAVEVQEVSTSPKYPLVNNGDFDFIKRGKSGYPYTGLFDRLEQTLEIVQGGCGVNSVRRMKSPMNGSTLNVEDDGNGTDMYWDTAEQAKTETGVHLWLDDNSQEHPETQIVCLPEDYNGDPYEDENLPIREKLIQAYVTYCSEMGIHETSSLEGAFGDIAEVIGFALTSREEQALLSIFRERLSPVLNFKAAADGDATGGECPSCGVKDCGHTPQQMQMFALEALKDASDWLDSLSKPEDPKA